MVYFCLSVDCSSLGVDEPETSTAVTTITIEATPSSSEAASATLVLEQFQNQNSVPDTLGETPMDVAESPAAPTEKPVPSVCSSTVFSAPQNYTAQNSEIISRSGANHPLRNFLSRNIMIHVLSLGERIYINELVIGLFFMVELRTKAWRDRVCD